VAIGDDVEAHGAALASISGTPTVFTASYYLTLPPNGHADTATQYGSKGFTVVRDIGTGGNSSVAVADFYGDGTYSLVCGDCKYGPDFPFDTTGPNYMGIVLWNLAGLTVAGTPFPVGAPYFNGKPQYAGYPSQWDPVKTHNYRAWVDDFNHDGKTDVVVQESIWSASVGTSKSILQMFQNRGGYQFADVTDSLDPQYDQNCAEADYVPQVRDIDASGINSWLSGSVTYSSAHPAANYVIANDGTGAFHVALHETLNSYGSQVASWLAANPALAAANYYVNPNLQPAIRAYRTPDGRLNFVAIAGVTRDVNPSLPLWITQYIFVNIPLHLDIASQFTQPVTIRNRNGSHLIRTFAGDDTIYSGDNGGYSRIDGGGGTNTVVYSGAFENYSVTRNGDGTWTIMDNVGTDGTDTLTRIQRLQFTDIVVRLDAPSPTGVSPGAGSGASQTFTFTFFDAGGYQNLGVVDVLINSALDGRHACYAAFQSSGANSGSLFLVDDAGDAGGPYQGLVLPGGGSISNSQCSINGALSSVSGSGNTLTLNLAITFSASFAGNKVVYTSAQDKSPGNSGWQALDTWDVPGSQTSGPSVSGMNPARSNTLAQTYTFTFSDTNGWQDIAVANVLINSAIDGRQACYVAFVPATASVLLVDDKGDAGGPYSGMVLPSSGSVSNSQCTISGTGSTVSSNGNTLTLTLAITFTQSFAGNQIFFLAARNNNGQNSNWQAVGTAGVP